MTEQINIPKKKSIERNALLAVLILFFISSITIARWFQWRNELPPLHLPLHPMPVKNAFDVFVSASNDLIDTDLVGFALSKKHTSANPYDREYSLTEKKKLVLENEGAIKKMVSGFELPYMTPPTRSFNVTYPYYVKFRAMARLLALKSEILQKEKRWFDAANCDMDILQIGAMCPIGGGIIPGLVGIAVSAIGSRDLAKFIDHLNLTQTKVILSRYSKIRKQRQAFADNLQEEKWSVLASLYSVSLDGAALGKQLGNPNDPNRKALRIALSLRILLYGKRNIIHNISAEYDECINYMRQDYNRNSREPRIRSDPISDELIPSIKDVYVKAAGMKAKVSLLYTALALHAYQCEHGIFPKSLSALEPQYFKKQLVDPFGNNEYFHYSTQGNKYILYSIGPDGKDHGGKPLQAGIPDENAKSNGPRHTIQKEDIGDIVAGINN